VSEIRERPRLGDFLVESGVITRDQLDRALKEQTSWGGRLGQSLLGLGFVDEVTLASAIARTLGMPSVDLDRATLPSDAPHILPLTVAERYGIMPIQAKREEHKLLLACFDPTNNDALTAVRRATGLVPEPYVATPSAIERAIRKHYYGEATPTPVSTDARFNVTRHTIDRGRTASGGSDAGLRLDDLERRLERLEHLVETLLDYKPR